MRSDSVYSSSINSTGVNGGNDGFFNLIIHKDDANI